MRNPGQTHWEAAKKVLKYLAGTRHHGLVFDGRRGLELQSYSDANEGEPRPGDDDAARATTGTVIMLAGCAVAWRSQLQADPALSSTETEYVALVETAKDVIWMRMLLEDAGAYTGDGSLTIIA